MMLYKQVIFIPHGILLTIATLSALLIFRWTIKNLCGIFHSY